MLQLSTVVLQVRPQVYRRFLLCLAIGAAALLQTACGKAKDPCKNVNAYVAYYYNYKDGHPEESDIRYIELVPAGGRCVISSLKSAPPFPDHSIDPQVKSGRMKIDESEGESVEIKGKADIAVYYGKEATSGSGGTLPPVLAVEDLKGVSRTIETVSVDHGSGACGNCPSIKCDGYSCCKKPPCP